MFGWGRLLLPVLLLAVVGPGCALLDSSEVADCDTVRVTFEDGLGHVRGTGEGDAEAGGETYGGDALRDVLALHDAREECFGREHREFLDPARSQLDDDQEGFPPVPAGEQPGLLGDPAGAGATEQSSG